MINWLGKIGLGLKKSSDKISGGISDIFGKKRLDAETAEELEELLISSDMGVKAAGRLVAKLKAKRLDKDADALAVRQALAAEIAQILAPCEAEFAIADGIKPYVILMVGVNGAGKTTTIGKLTAQLQKQGKQVSLIAADTFRAAAVEQLQVWGERNRVRVFSGHAGCDSAGLCYDGLEQAVAAGDDVVFIDTAGRLQNKVGLMDELQKIVRVIKKILPSAPHSTLLTLDATTGQNALAQVQTFKQCTDINGLIITKLDGTAKGGILVAIAEENPTPVCYIGVGEGIDDLQPFVAETYANALMEL